MDRTDVLKTRLLLAARLAAAFRRRNYEIVQYGGATVEQYSRGAYTTGDIDLGFIDRAPTLEEKMDVMRQFGCDRGTRLFTIEGVVIDLDGVAELLSDHLQKIETSVGPILLEAPEESLVQRVLNSIYPVANADQKRAAQLLIAQALQGNLAMDWAEVDRLAQLPGFKVQDIVATYQAEVLAELARG